MILCARDPLGTVLLAAEPAPLAAALGRAGLETLATAVSSEAAVAALATTAADVWVAEAGRLTRAACEAVRSGAFADPLARPALLVVGRAGAAADDAALAMHAGAVAFLPAEALADAARVTAEVARVREAVHLRRLGRLAVAAPARYAERLAVPEGNALRFVPVTDVDAVHAERSHAVLHVGAARVAVRETLAELEARLDPAVFCRVHRSTIVRLGAVAALRSAPGGDYAVVLADGSVFSVGRARRATLLARLGVAAPAAAPGAQRWQG
ncbi:MAG: LytR/AlgR family response regulator transcription factor [Rubricoccaceae bacterium]